MASKIFRSTKKVKTGFRSPSLDGARNLMFNSASIPTEEAIENIYGPNILITENEVPLALELTNEVIAYA